MSRGSKEVKIMFNWIKKRFINQVESKVGKTSRSPEEGGVHARQVKE